MVLAIPNCLSYQPSSVSIFVTVVWTQQCVPCMAVWIVMREISRICKLSVNVNESAHRDECNNQKIVYFIQLMWMYLFTMTSARLDLPAIWRISRLCNCLFMWTLLLTGTSAKVRRLCNLSVYVNVSAHNDECKAGPSGDLLNQQAMVFVCSCECRCSQGRVQGWTFHRATSNPVGCVHVPVPGSGAVLYQGAHACMLQQSQACVLCMKQVHAHRDYWCTHTDYWCTHTEIIDVRSQRLLMYSEH